MGHVAQDDGHIGHVASGDGQVASGDGQMHQWSLGLTQTRGHLRYMYLLDVT